MHYEPTHEDLVQLAQAEQEALAEQRTAAAATRAVLERVKTMVSEAAYTDIEEVIDESGHVHNFSVEPVARGTEEDEVYAFGKMFVNQTLNGGYSGDDYAGTISIPIGPGQYLQFHYSM